MKFNKVLVIGAGGTGSILLPQLTRFLRSQKFEGQLLIADGDKYDDKNSERQTFALSKTGMNKAEYQATALVNHLPDMEGKIDFLPEYLSKEKIEQLIEENTMIVNCVDNVAARKYVEDKCETLNNVAHICCGNELSSGQVQVNLRRNGERLTSSIYKHSPNFNSDREDRSKLTCEQLAELPGGGQLIGANMMAASVALNYVIQLHQMDMVTSSASFFNCFTNSMDIKDKVVPN